MIRKTAITHRPTRFIFTKAPPANPNLLSPVYHIPDSILKPHRGLIHCGFFKSVSRVYKKRSPALLPSFFLGAGNRTGFSRLGQRRSQAPPGLDSLRLLQVRFPSLQKKKPSAFAELFFLVRETGLDSRGSTPLGQRRSQAPPGLDSLRLLQVRFPSLQKKKPSAFAELFFLVRETGLEPA